MAKQSIQQTREELFARKNQDEEISIKVEISKGNFINFNGSVENVRFFLYQLETKAEFLADNLSVII